MKKDNLYIILIVFVALIVAYLIYITMHPIFAFKLAIKKAVTKYGKDVASNVEKIFRLESGNFTSGQWLGTYSAGMQNYTNSFPYGWTSLASWWNENPAYKPNGILPFTENGTGKTVTFIQFPSVEAAVMTTCEFLDNHDNNAARWFSTDATNQANYQHKIDSIKATIVESV